MTRQRIAWVVWAVVLVGSLAAVKALNDGAATTGRRESAGSMRYGFALRESAKARGVEFIHQAPTFDAQLEHIMPQIASMGASVAIADFDRDGRDDFYVTNSGEGSLNRLYRSKGDGTFEEVAQAMGVADLNRVDDGSQSDAARTEWRGPQRARLRDGVPVVRGRGVSMGAVWGDYDNDGYEDLFVYKYGQPELFHNERGQSFTRVTERAGLPRWSNANAATWFDYDRDGFLDLFLAGYWPDGVDLWHLKTTRIMPESFEYANNGGRKYLLHNRGDGTFEDKTEALGTTSHRWTLAVIAADFFGSGYPDLFLANDYGVPELYANRGGKAFEEVGRTTGVGIGPKSGMNAAVGDIFNDGRLSIYKTNISEPGVLVQGNDLWVPKADAGEGAVEYENLASSIGIDLGGWSWGAQFGDLNNDGTQDIYLVNGYISAGERSSYWYDFAEIAVGHSTIIGDARNWPAMRGRSLSGYQRKRVWVNDGAGRFTEVAQSVGATDTFDGRAVALADLDNRGMLDAIVASQKGPLQIYTNTIAPGRHWIQFQLEGTGKTGGSNRSAIGARVEVHWQEKRQVQQIAAASGFSAQNQRRLHYGLGSADGVERVVIRWPSGRTQTIEHPAVDMLHRIQEPDAR